MKEENILLHKLAIDLNRSLKDIKENMSWYEFKQWSIFYSNQISNEKLSYQLSQITELIYKSNFEGEVTILDFMPNATEEEKSEARQKLKQAKIEEELKKLDNF